MLLDLDPDVFDADDHTPLLDLLTMIAKEQHDWHPSRQAVDRAEDLVSALTAAQLKMPRIKSLVTLLRAAIEEGGYPRALRRLTKVTGSTLARVVEDLRRPAVLLVENRYGDGEFVRAVAFAFGDTNLIRALQRRWLEFNSSGGTGQMPTLATEECGRFAVLVRVAMLLDSDRSSVGEVSRNEAKAEAARLAGVAHVHVFRRRMMENYLPLRVWEHHLPPEDRFLKQLRAADQHGRSYWHLKDRFAESRAPGQRKKLPAPLLPDDLDLTEADFIELGAADVAELRKLLAMIHEIL